MSHYTFEHAGGKFVSGLFWQVLSRPREAKQEAKELGESMQFDFMVLRNAGSVIQSGFAARADGAGDGMISFAATIARVLEDRDNPPQNWIAAVELPNGDVGFVAVREGAMLPDGDVCGTREEILNRMTAEYGLGEWDVVVCPDDFGFPGSVPRGFEEFLPLDKKGKVKAPPSIVLDPLKRKLPIKQIAAGVAVIVVVGVAYMLYSNYVESEEFKAREQALLEQKLRMEEEEKRKAMASPPWATVPDSMSLVKACEDAVFTLDLKPSDWSFDGAVCNAGGSMTAVYKRGESSATVFDVKAQLGDGFRTDWSGESGSLQKKLEAVTAKPEVLWKSDELVMKMVGTAQKLGLKLTVKSPSSPVGPGVPVAQEVSVLKFKRLVFNAESEIQPSYFSSVIDLPGVRVQNLKVDLAGKWSFDGEIYVSE